MPLFEYQCEKCGVRFERLQRKSDPILQLCPECGGALHRLIQPPGIIFKGSGFYVTDNRRSSSGSRHPGAKPSSDRGSETSDSKSTKDDSS